MTGAIETAMNTGGKTAVRWSRGRPASTESSLLLLGVDHV